MKKLLIVSVFLLVMLSGCVRNGSDLEISYDRKLSLNFEHGEIKQGDFADIQIEIKNNFKYPLIILSIQSDSKKPISERLWKSYFGSASKVNNKVYFNQVAQTETGASGAYFFSGAVNPGQKIKIPAKIKFLEDNIINRTINVDYITLDHRALNSLYIKSGPEKTVNIEYSSPKSVQEAINYISSQNQADIIVFDNDRIYLKKENESFAFKANITLLDHPYSSVEDIVGKTLAKDYTFSNSLNSWAVRIKGQKRTDLIQKILDNSTNSSVTSVKTLGDVDLEVFDFIDTLHGFVNVYDYANKSCMIDLHKKYNATEPNVKYNDGSYTIKIPKGDINSLFSCIQNSDKIKGVYLEKIVESPYIAVR